MLKGTRHIESCSSVGGGVVLLTVATGGMGLKIPFCLRLTLSSVLGIRFYWDHSLGPRLFKERNLLPLPWHVMALNGQVEDAPEDVQGQLYTQLESSTSSSSSSYK